MKIVLRIFFLISVQLIFCQNYKTVDSIVNTYPKKFKSIERFSDRIRLDFSTDLDRTRAAYYWLANNIVYDYKALRKKKKNKKIKSKSKADYNVKVNELYLRIANKALRKKTAVCEGYAQLFQHTLTKLGINSIVISGYAKTLTNEIGRKRNNSNHAWNAVKIEQKWYLIDVTWSTGNSIYNNKFFNFSDTYFMIDPEKLILSHFPDDVQWQLLEKPVTRIDYFNFPIAYKAYHTSGLKLKNKAIGYIKTKTDSIINISFSKIDPNKSYYYNFEGTSLSEKIKFSTINELKIAAMPYTFKKRRHLIISDGEKALLKFRLRLIKN